MLIVFTGAGKVLPPGDLPRNLRAIRTGAAVIDPRLAQLSPEDRQTLADAVEVIERLLAQPDS